MIRYNNYHKHTHLSNLRTLDSVTKPQEYMERAKELGQTCYFTTEHGFQGNIFEAFTLCQEYGLKCIYGVEAYYTDDIQQKTDRSAYHIILVAMTENARKEINKIMSIANTEGFYYKPRIDMKLLLSLNPKETIITTACIASRLFKGEDWENSFFLPLYNHFKENLYLEIQAHSDQKQIEYNKNILALHNKYNVKMIHGNDSHYIKPNDAKYRELFLKAKGITYPEESGFILDYPDSDEILRRYREQGVFTEEQVIEALENTLVFDNAEGIYLDKEFKIPKIVEGNSNDELRRIINESWRREKIKIPKEEWPKYIEQIKYEYKIIEDCGMADYFILDYYIAKKAVNEYGAVMTRTGRGCFTEDALVHTKDQLKSIKDVKIGDYVVTKDGNWNKVLNTMCYDIDEPMVKIKHLYGTDKYNPTICTLDHKILINRDNNIVWKQAKDLLKTDYVCVPKIKTKKEVKDIIDLNDYNVFNFKYDDEYIYETRSNTSNTYYPYSCSDVARHIGISDTVVERFVRNEKGAFKRNPEKIKEMLDYIPFDTVEEYREYIKSHRTIKIKRYIKNDVDFNIFIGLMYGDGVNSTDRNCIGLAINTDTTKNDFNRKIFIDIANRLNIPVSENKDKKRSLSQLYMNSKVFSEYVKTELFASQRKKEKIFNCNLFNQTIDNLNGIITGLRHSDGNYGTDNRINFDNTSLSLINAYKLLCLMTGEGVNSLSVRPSWTDKNGYKCKTSYKLRLQTNRKKVKKSINIKEDDNYYYLPITSIEILPKQKTKVYDITVENESNYLLNNMIVHNSAVSFYINKLLGLTEVDRIDAPITLYPTRFMSAERILQSRSIPDIDQNYRDVKPVIKASKDILGEDGIYYMIAYKPLQESSAFRLWCKANDYNINDYDEVAKDLENHLEDPKWKTLIEDSKIFRGVIESVAPSPCFEKNTLIMTSKGYKNIQDIATDDYVMTHNNRFKRVIAPMKTFHKQALKIKFMGSDEIITTNNHPFYIRHFNGYELIKKSKNKYTQERVFSDPEWVAAENIRKGDYVGIAINQNSIIPQWNGTFNYGNNKQVKKIDTNDKNFWWLVGRYIGDGWSQKYILPNGNVGYYRTTICCNNKTNEKQIIIEYLKKLKFNYTVVKEGSIDKIQISNKELFEFLDQFGHGALNKHLTNMILDLPVDYLKVFLEGYLSADGHYIESTKTQTYTTISKELAIGIQECIYKVYHVPTRFRIKNDSGKPHMIENRLVNTHIAYDIRFKYNENKTDQGFYENGYIWVPFRQSSIIEYNDYLYNMSVEDDESYTVNNMIVHNCSFLLSNDPISKEIGLIKVGDEICCCLDGYNCDCYKWLKNDYLTVKVYELIDETYKLIGRPIDDIETLVGNCDDEVWKLYENGLTATINQADSNYDKQILMKYKPKNLSELSAYVAAIRPGFSTLLNTFINREDYSTGVKELDDILEDSYHYLMYQESIMKYLTWLGIEEKGTYDIIKKISKKKFKEPELKELKEKLLSGWMNRVGKEEGFEKTWEVVEAAASYSFNASHSLCVALDSLYGAYLKSHYPLEYYSVAFNSYADDMDRTDALTKELSYFGIKILPIKFRHSKAEYNMDKETNSIYKGMASIKYMNENVSERLYEMRNEKFNSFIDLLKVFPGDSRQLDILIKLNFFEEFGKAKKLLNIVDVFNKYYGKKQIKKEKLDIEEIGLFEKYAVSQSDKMFKMDEDGMTNVIKEMCEMISNVDIPLTERLAAENEFLGYMATTVPDEDDNVGIVSELTSRGRNFFATIYNLKNGETVKAKIKSKLYKITPVDKNDKIKYRLEQEYPWTMDENKNWIQDTSRPMENIVAWYGVY